MTSRALASEDAGISAAPRVGGRMTARALASEDA